MQREISFYSDRYGKHVSGLWSVFGGRITVIAPDGRQQTTHLGDSTPETLARSMLRSRARGGVARPTSGKVSAIHANVTRLMRRCYSLAKQLTHSWP